MICAVALDHTNADWQIESPRTRAAGIEQQLSADDLVSRLVAVAENNDVGFLAQQRVAKYVREENAANDLRLVTGVVVIVAADELHWCDGAQRFDHVIATDVAGVQNQIDAPQRFERFGADQAVCVGDNADPLKTAALGPPDSGGPLSSTIPRYSLFSPRRSSGTGL